MSIFPQKLKAGDQIRIIAPSKSLSVIRKEIRELAEERLVALGLKVTYGKHVEERDLFDSSSISARISDLHEAFRDKNVKGILTAIGGFNCNQLLQYIDYSVVATNPKPLCGFSDITALANAIYAKTSLVTYSGPHFSSFGMAQGLDYTVDYFKACLLSNAPFFIEQSKVWSDDPWPHDQEKREFLPNEGYFVINNGRAEGVAIGGNLCTFNLLQGTEYMPSLHNSILFIEDDLEVHPATVDRDLQSLIHQNNFEGVRGIVVGRFQKASKMTPEKLLAIFKSKRELHNLPIIANASFGHTSPQCTFPIGGRVRLEVCDDVVRLEVVEH